MKGTDYKDIFNPETNSTKLISGKELLAKELELLLNFKKYTLFFGNGMGLDCERYIHLTNRKATFNLIKSDIEKLFSKYKRAKIKNITMKFNESSNTIEIKIDAVPNTSGFSTMSTPTMELSLSLSN